MARVYLDHHATTPVDPRVEEAMAPYWGQAFGNAASAHIFGWEAAEAVENARAQIAASIACKPSEIVFTSGATEADNLAILGSAPGLARRGRHFVTSAIEHPAVLDALRHLEAQGAELSILPVDSEGRVRVDELKAALRDDTVLCSVMWANNEIGTIQPVGEISAACRERGVLFHTDAVQAVGRIPMAIDSIDMLSLTAHKIYGPKGIGALIVRRRTPRIHLQPLLFGGGHQDGLRSGTLPVALIVGLGEACALAASEREQRARHVQELRDHLLYRLQAEIEDLTVNGTLRERLPGNLNVCIQGVEAEALLLELREVAASTGSACSSAEHHPSSVLLGLGLSPDEAHASIRFGVGKDNTLEEIDAVCDAIVKKVEVLRSFSRHDSRER
jgi:cysteine desulfurase